MVTAAVLLVATGCTSAALSEPPVVAGITQLPQSSTTSIPPITEAPTTEAPTTAAPATSASTLPARSLAADLDWLGGSEGPNVQISASVRSLDGQELWGLNSQTRLYPASNQKLVVAAGVLELLEPDHRFVTEVAVDPDQPGTLFVIAGGDPTMTTARLAALAKSVAGGSTGPFDRLVVDLSRWKTAYRAPGWQDWHIPTYVGPLSVFMLDDNRWSKTEDFTTAPDLTNAARFAALLRTAGVRGDLVPSLGSSPDEANLQADSVSQPVEQLIVSMLRSSDNQTADALVRELDAQTESEATTPGGLNQIRTALRTSGVELDGIDGDGSGLSRANLRSASEWTAFLASVQDEPWFADFEQALPVAGRSGTMSSRLQGAATVGNVRAKTGTIIGGRSLSGYVTLTSGEDVAFSIVVNGDGSHDMLGEMDRWVTAVASGRLG